MEEEKMEEEKMEENLGVSKRKTAAKTKTAAASRAKRGRKASESESIAESLDTIGEDVETASVSSVASSLASSSTTYSSDGAGRRSSRRKTIVMEEDASSVDGTVEGSTTKEAKGKRTRKRVTPRTSESLPDVQEDEEEEIPVKRKRGATAKKKT